MKALGAAIQGFIEGFPCNVIGHKWHEVPLSLRVSKFNRDPDRLRFRCQRCGLMSGGTN